MSESSQNPQEEKKLLEMREDDAPQKKGIPANVKKEIREWVVAFAVALVVAFLIRTFLFTVIRVDGDSMRETLHDKDRMIVTIIDMKLNGVNRGDVVICHYPGRKENFVKRVIGLGGDTIEVKDGTTYRNGEALDESYIVHKPDYDFGPLEVPDGKVFVLGDNRADSNDSHVSAVGPIDESQLVGIARLIIWPPSDIGPIGGP